MNTLLLLGVDPNDVCNHVEILIDGALKHRNTLGTTEIDLQARLTEAARIATLWVEDTRDDLLERAEPVAYVVSQETITCERCERLKTLRNVLGALAPLAPFDMFPGRDIDGLCEEIDEQINDTVHDEAHGCDHLERENFTALYVDDGYDSEY